MILVTQLFSQKLLTDFLETAGEKLLTLIGWLLVCHLGRRLARYLIRKMMLPSLAWEKNEARQKTLLKLFQNSVDYVAYFVLFYGLLSLLGVPVSSLLAGAGIAGVAIGLGAQGFLSDLVNGLFILIESQYDVGDYVSIERVSGTVSSVGIRTTQIRDLDGTLHFIPNRHITIVSNRSRGDMRVQIDIPIYADSDLQTIERVIREINQREVSNYPEIVGSPTILGPRTTQNGQFIFRIDIFVQNGLQTNIYHAFYRHYQEGLRANGILLPTANILPQQAVSVGQKR